MKQMLNMQLAHFTNKNAKQIENYVQNMQLAYYNYKCQVDDYTFMNHETLIFPASLSDLIRQLPKEARLVKPGWLYLKNIYDVKMFTKC